MNYTYIFIGLFILFLISIGFVMNKNSTEPYNKCVCSSAGSGRERDCQDTDVIQKMYEDGKATENSNFQNKGWSETSPGDMNFPISKGCNWENNQDTGAWLSWDFTDF